MQLLGYQEMFIIYLDVGIVYDCSNRNLNISKQTSTKLLNTFYKVKKNALF